jgi:hypothetical protein
MTNLKPVQRVLTLDKVSVIAADSVLTNVQSHQSTEFKAAPFDTAPFI